jgi:hypothetical protein
LVFIGSAMRTAPPCNNATPAAAAESFAMASLSDIVGNPVCLRCWDANCPHLLQIQRSFDVRSRSRAIRLTMQEPPQRLESAQI